MSEIKEQTTTPSSQPPLVQAGIQQSANMPATQPPSAQTQTTPAATTPSTATASAPLDSATKNTPRLTYALMITIAVLLVMGGVLAWYLEIPDQLVSKINPSVSISLSDEPTVNDANTAPPLSAQQDTTVNNPDASDSTSPFAGTELELQLLDQQRARDAQILLNAFAQFKVTAGHLPQFSNSETEALADFQDNRFGVQSLIPLQEDWMITRSDTATPCPVVTTIGDETSETCSGTGQLKTSYINQVIQSESQPDLGIFFDSINQTKRPYICFQPQSQSFQQQARVTCEKSSSGASQVIPQNIPSVQNQICGCLTNQSEACYYCVL